MKTWMLILTLALAACGEATESNNRSSNTTTSNAPSCAGLPAGGDFCSTSDDCTPVDCPCADGAIITSRSCDNGVCGGVDSCSGVCASSGSTTTCTTSSNNTNNTTSNNGTTSNPNNTTPAMCDADLSKFADFAIRYDVACLEQNCCDQAAYCGTFGSCQAYDDCVYGCFSNGTLDQDCVRTCQQTEATSEFLTDAYSPFAACALDNGC